MAQEDRVEEKIITRRDFVKGTISLGVTFGLKGVRASSNILDKAFSAGMEKPLAKSAVVLIRDGRAIGSDHRLNTEIMYEMIDMAMGTFIAGNISEPWQIYVSPIDMLTSGLAYPKAKKTPTDQKTIYAVTVPFDRYKEIINDSGAKLDKAWQKANLVNEVRLVIIDALRPDSIHNWDYRGFLVGKDPLAVATVCHEINQRDEWPVKLESERVVATIDIEYGGQNGELPEIKAIRADREKMLWLSKFS